MGMQTTPSYPWSSSPPTTTPSSNITQFPYPGPAVSYIQGLVASAPGVITSVVGSGNITVTSGPAVTIGMSPNPSFVTETLTGGTLTFTGATTNTINFSTGTSNFVLWQNTAGVAPPSFTTRSVGTRIVLFPSIGAASVDYALGIDNSTFWMSVPAAGQGFRWYAGTTSVASLTGAGTFAAIAVESQAGGSTPAYCPPSYTAAGTITAVTEHVIRGSVTASVGLTSTVATATVTLVGASIFTSTASYTVTANYEVFGSTFPTGWVASSLAVIINRVSASSFQLQINNSAVSTSTGTLVINYQAQGT